MARSRTEKLKLVFSLTDLSLPLEHSRLGKGIKVQPRKSAIDALNAARIVVERLEAKGYRGKFFDGANRMSANSFLKVVENRGFWGRVESPEFVFEHGIAGSFNQSFVTIEERTADNAGDWDSWAEPFIKADGLVQAWISDVEYSFWQNEKDLNSYEMAGRRFEHLQMKSNGLPPPVERLEIDISKNPGREILRSGFVEAVGARMWFGMDFFNRIGYSQSHFLSAVDWLDLSKPAPDILEIRASKFCFYSDETAEIQNRLRRFIYV